MTRKKKLGTTKTIPTIIFLIIILLLPNFLTGKDNQKQILWSHNLTKKSLGKRVSSENVEKLSIEFLTSAKEFTELNTNNIKLKKSNHNMGNWYLVFEQVHQGIPVNGGHVGMVVKENGEILLTSTKFYDDINVQITPKITAESAIEIANTDFAYSGLTQVVSSSLAILPNEEKLALGFHLCWKIELFAKDPAEGKTIYIDANNGSIVKRINTVRKSVSGTVNGWIWPENYLSTWSSGNVQDSVLNVFEHEMVELVGTAYEDVTDDDGDYFIVQGSQGDDIYSSLVGPYVEVHNSQSGVSTDEYQSDSNYSWTWDDMSNHCDEYNVFYHVNLIYNYYYDNFGYEWDSGSQMNAYVYVNSIHAYYSSGTQSIYFGINKYNSYDPYQRFYARTSDVIYHEYSHAVKDDINANNNSAIDEGFSDYFACTIVGESLYGEGYHSGRQLKDNQYFYYYPDDITGSSHNNGTIIAGGAWDLRDLVGSSVTDQVVFEGLNILGTIGGTPSFSDLVTCILKADDDIYGDNDPTNGTPNQDDILDAFRNHHIYPNGYVFSGSIDTNDPQTVSWESDMVITGDVTVNSDVTLSIGSGISATFVANQDDQSSGLDANLSELTIQGKIEADGVTFTSSSSTANSWYGIILDGPTYTSYIKNSTIQWAKRGIIVDDCSPSIEGNDLDNNQYGIWVHGSSSYAVVKENDINNGSLPLVVSSDAEPYIYDNQSRELEKCLYIASGGYPEVRNNTLYGYTNGMYQVYITGSNSGITTASSSGYGNYFTDDVNYDIVQIDCGIDFVFNYDVFQNVSSSSYDYIDNNDATQCEAENCYWDDGGVPSSSYFDGNVDYTPVLATEPSAGVTWKLIASSPSPFESGFLAYKNKDYEYAASELKTAFETNYDHKDAHRALFYISRSAMRISEQAPYLTFFDEIIKDNYDEESKQIARSALMRHFARSGQLSKSESYAMDAPKGILYDRELLLDMVYYYALYEDKAGEARVISVLTEVYGDDKSIEVAIENVKLLIEDERKFMQMSPAGEGPGSSGAVNNANENLLTAFPNPFNPSTTIRYTLIEPGNVTLKIYNIKGQQVALLVNGHQDAGAHDIVFNTIDLPSGVYLYQLRAGSFHYVKKIVLVR